jgi:hypothetical protein
MRIQDNSSKQDITDEVQFMDMMSTASLAPKMFGNYMDDRNHGMLSERYDQDLEGWFRESTTETQTKSMWMFRVRRLLCGMSKLGLFCIDLKPANVVVKTELGIIDDLKLIDFGGGLCWKESESWPVLYVTMLLVFSASMLHSHPDIYTKSGTDGPFGTSLRRMLSAYESRAGVPRILGKPLTARYWANLFFRVPMQDYIQKFTK